MGNAMCFVIAVYKPEAANTV